LMQDRVETSPEQMAACTALAESISSSSGLYTRVVGWYHSHPHITVLPSHVDVATQVCGVVTAAKLWGLQQQMAYGQLVCPEQLLCPDTHVWQLNYLLAAMRLSSALRPGKPAGQASSWVMGQLSTPAPIGKPAGQASTVWGGGQ
jgi:hypothetical protein